MFAAAIVVFRESLEAALIIGIMAAATRGIPMRNRWIAAGVIAGVLGAGLVAASMEALSEMASGMGQELFNAGILAVAVGMLAWHNIWMASHGREMANQAKSTAKAIHDGVATHSVIFVVVGLAVLREGAETVLFLYGLATSSADGWNATLMGGSAGLLGGAVVGGLLYAGLLRIPLKWFFSFTSALVLLLTAGMASQAARFLMQADVLPALGAPVWDTSGVLDQNSAAGTLLHGMIGYDAQPAGIQLVFYVTALVLTLAGMYWASPKKQQPHKA